MPCTVIRRADDLAGLAQALDGAAGVAIDTETPIDGPQAGQLRVMSVATRSADGTEQSFVVDARDVHPRHLAPLLDGVVADAWNADFDARVLDAAVWSSADTTHGLRWWDAQLADALIHQGRSGVTWYHGLAWATEHYLGIVAEGKGSIQLTFTAFDDLTDDQLAYAAADAVETLWVADAIRAEITAAGLDEVCAIEMAARPFLDQMERTGLPFDRDGWSTELVAIEQQQRQTVGRLAALTGGGQGTLFDDVVEPSWNPGSDRQVRRSLNRWSAPEVEAWTTHRYRFARLLTDDDSVTADVLREIGGELASAVLDFRHTNKILTTYGDSILEHLDDDGRMRPQYLQVVGTNTGRLASRNPNAQNFTPLMKPYVRPPQPDRVFVHADLSQAELRYLAQVANDGPLRAAFTEGVDVHVRTAATMFGFDPDTLQADDPARFARLRQIAKALNFGIAYGSGAAALARSLTVEGTPTTLDEAGELLSRYRRTYPGTTAWAEARIAEIERLSGEVPLIDWPLSLRLARGFGDVNEIRRSFRRQEQRWPSAADIADLHPDQDDPNGRSPSELLTEIEWLLRYPAPVALLTDGQPFTFASRTGAGRRQQFNLHLDRIFLDVATAAIDDQRHEMVAARRRFERQHHVTLNPGDAANVLEDRRLRRRFIDALVEDCGSDLIFGRLRRVARDRVSAMVNAWRNAPIQGGVADIMLVAYGDLHHRLRQHPTARPVQTVHDSIVIECDRGDAGAVAADVVAALEAASLRYCPDVTPKVDVDVRTSLSDRDVLADHDVAASG